MTSEQFHIPGKYAKQVQDFFALYDVEKVITCAAEDLKANQDRVCRFCGKGSPLTTFDKAAHTIPELLGNHTLLSDSECDACNKKIGLEYESHLAHFLGITRTLSGIRGKNKVPDFTSPRYKLTAKHSTNDNPYGTVVLDRKDESDDTFSVDAETGEMIVKFQSNSYVPLKVYKAFLKMALSCIPEKYLNAYKFAFEYLMTDGMDNDLKPLNEIFMYTLPQAYARDLPVGILFKKKTNQSNIFTHIFLLSYSNLIFEFAIPLHIVDTHHALSNSMYTYWSPPIFSDSKTAEEMGFIDVQQNIVSLSSIDVCKDGWGLLRIPTDKRENLETGNVDYAKIVKIEIIREPIK